MKRITVDSVSKKFRIGFKKDQSALARFISLFSGREPKRTIWALKKVSFSADAGEIIGVIGENGSGKSTLLRIIAGIYDKSGGEVKTEGKIVSLINLYIGLRERLTMEDNIYMCSSLFGLSAKEAKKRFDSIVEFSELRDFVNTKIYQFSEGMKQRLAFSIAIHCDPDIFLIDEVFEVGDEEFKIKSVNKIKEFLGNGATVLLVTHELWMVEKYCNRAIRIDKGRIVKDGNSRDVIKDYSGRQSY